MTRKQKKTLYRIIIASILIVLLHFLPAKGWAAFALYLIPYIVIGYDILRKAALGIAHGEVFDENFLMAVATVGAMALGVYEELTTGQGEFAEGVAVMLFYQIGELFQSVAVGKSRKNITALMDIRPDYANIENADGNLEQVDPDDVAVGSVIVVRPGEKIPIDGVVEEGSSSLNASALTGESIPRQVETGDSVISGCVNLNGLLKIRTSREFGESTVSKILDLVENSSMKKSKAENFISRFARYYTPAVCYSALALGLLPPIIRMFLGYPAGWSVWIIRALTFLVISCPCALVISMPLSFFGGIGGAGACGILVKGSNYLEAMAKTKYIVFDKTGTLTKGVFQVTGIYPSADFAAEQPAGAAGQGDAVQQSDTAQQDNALQQSDATQQSNAVQQGNARQLILEYAAYAESYSGHPISKSLREAYGREIDNSLLSNVEEISGHGVTARVKDADIAVGNARLMASLGLECPEHSETGTVVHVAVNGVYGGRILIADVMKEESENAIKALKSAGIKKTVLLTGDNRAAAEQAAEKLHIDEVHSELLPADKVDRVEKLLTRKRPGEVLAFVGDGINDAPVLSRADIGIAMGAMGSDAAIEAADIVLMDDNPEKIALAIRIARKCLRIVYENIVFALGVKGICLILGAAGIANMWLAIFADVGVMVIAVLNAIRCLKVRNLSPKKFPAQR